MIAEPMTEAPFLDLFGADFQTNPHGTLKGLREQHWYARTAMGNAALRYEPVQQLLMDQTFRTPSAFLLAMQGFTEGPIVELMSSFLLNSEGVNHDRLRRLVNRAFMGRFVENFRPRMRALAGELLEKFIGRGQCEFMQEFAMPFAWRSLCEFVGFPKDRIPDMYAWNEDFGLIFGMTVAQDQSKIETAITSLYNFMDALAEERRREPKDDLLSGLVKADENGDALTTQELRGMLITLMSAGSDTSTHQIGNAMATFLAHPEQWNLLARQPELVNQAAEEVIRYNPAVVLGVPRAATVDVMVNGLELYAGEIILPVTGSANRDAGMFEAPETFDITRKGRSHLTFGGGIHYCLGAPLGRAELQEVLGLLPRRLTDIQAAGDIKMRPPTGAVYGPTELPMRFTAHFE